jgi:hypothetical protein
MPVVAHGKPALRSLAHPTLPRPPQPAPTFTTMANAPLIGTGCGGYRLIWVFGKTEYFCKRGWTGFREASPSGKSAEPRGSTRSSCGGPKHQGITHFERRRADFDGCYVHRRPLLAQSGRSYAASDDRQMLGLSVGTRLRERTLSYSQWEAPTPMLRWCVRIPGIRHSRFLAKSAVPFARLKLPGSACARRSRGRRRD